MDKIVNTIKAILKAITEGFLSFFDWNRPSNKKSSTTTGIVADVLVVLILLIIIRQGIGELRYIPSESMEPTLIKGDKLCVEKISRIFKRHYERGDVVIFYPPPAAKDGEEVIKNDPFRLILRLTGLPISEFLTYIGLPEIKFLAQPEAFIKRIVGVPGDKIKIIKNQGVFVNNQPLYEPYHHNSVDYLPEYSTDTIEIPEGYYYVLGDNRNYSYDSHYWGLLSEKRVIGRAAFIMYRSLDNKPEIKAVRRKN